MSLAIGSMSAVFIGSTSLVLSVPASTGGSSPVSVQMYRSTVSGFTPGSAGNIVGSAFSGNSASNFADSGLTPGVTYYYQAIATDAAMATASTPQLTAAVAAYSPNPNQATLLPFLGMLDQRYNGNTISCVFDPSATGSLVAGQAVTFTHSGSNAAVGSVFPSNGDPMVQPSTAGSDLIAGFVNYNLKNAVFLPGDRLEISAFGNVMYLLATGAIHRGAQVNSLPAAQSGGCNGGVESAVSGSPWCGVSLDEAVVGSFVRILIQTPANTVLHS